jgi:hypothetical protein
VGVRSRRVWKPFEGFHANRHRLGLAILIVAAGATTARAQERPSENDIFATPSAPVPATATPCGGFGTDSPPCQPPRAAPAPVAATTSGGEAQDSRDQLNLGTIEAAPRLSAEVAPEDPLRIGGQIYLRAQSSGLQGQSPADWSLSSPSLLDVYMDVRPNERVRGYVRGRMTYDPTLPSTASPTMPAGYDSSSQGGSSSGGTASLASLVGPQQTRTPRVVLDQMWLSFDIKHAVFVTAGRQHVRWGTARFWTPTEFLHLQHRNPLDVFDARTGTTMLKLHVPWEARGWNFYAYGLTEGADATPTASRVAGAARAEVVLGTAELGAGALVQRGHKPKLAADISAGIWDFDFYGEVALRFASEIDHLQRIPGSDANAASLGTYDQTSSVPQAAQIFGPYYQSLFVPVRGSGVKPQATGGVSYSFQYADKDVFTLGAEYFYNGLGYNDTQAYGAIAILPYVEPVAEPATFFYLGRHYAAVYATAPAPYSWDNTTFTLSTLGNLSDRSGITRLDYSLILLTHLRFEAFAAVHWGKQGGEFRIKFGPTSAPLLDLGVGLRVSI